MTKAELIKALEKLPDDTDIYVPSTECSNVWVHAGMYKWTVTEATDVRRK